MTIQITQKYLTKNDCYKAGRKIKPKGIMVHSTGAKNPKLSRYIQPDDGVLGKNPYNNDWNRSGISKCVHAFIGEDKNGNVRCYQTLPWDYRGWHGGGSSNNSYIGFEICEDGLVDRVYFNKVYDMAVDLCVHLCKKFGLTERDIIDHSEGYKKGIASNHGDVMHWFPRHGKSMDTFRADVKKRLNGKTPSKSQPSNNKGGVRMLEITSPALKKLALQTIEDMTNPSKYENPLSKTWLDKAKKGQLPLDDAIGLLLTEINMEKK